MAVKDMLPLGARRAIKWAGYAALDVIKPVQEARIPPRRQTSIGGGDFKAIGENFARRLQKTGLKPDDCLLDVGCGQGRMARPLVPYLTGGRYEGFDIDSKAIAWCQDAYADVANFTFTHLDVFNARYNPGGARGRVIFPYPDGLFDAVLVTSVFTHMFEDDIANYITEIARVLEPGGFALLTAFLKADGPGRLGFHHTLGENSWTTLPDMPEAAVAVDELWFREQLSSAGLYIQSLDRGSCWEGGNGNVQDVMVVRKLI
jgi:SAM-dependent methyltransferase